VEKTLTLTLDNLAKEYVGYLPSRARDSAIQELSRFIRWCGRDRPVSEITPNEISSYAQWAAPSGGEALKRLDPVKKFLTHLKKRGHTTDNLSLHLKVSKEGKRHTVTIKGLQEPVPMTKEGFLQLQQELEDLKASRVNIAQELNRARADKDFRENAPLDAAREHQGQVEARIRELEGTLKSATITNGEFSNPYEGARRVHVGSRVILRDLAGRDYVTYTLVNPNEASIINGRLSATSPTGKAILEKEEGVEVSVAAPMGSISYRIEKIEN